MTSTLPLNQGQQAAADGFFDFLLSDEKELIISGPGGVGKTFLMGHLIDQIMPRYQEICRLINTPILYDEVVMTATTNKAAEVLGKATGRPTKTIHSHMSLKPQADYATGISKLSKTMSWKVHERQVLFIDECSMIDTPLRTGILEGTHKCKIVYIGDHCQLAPVMEPLSPVFRSNLPFYELTQQMRNSNQPALAKLCDQLRRTVQTGIFEPIEIVPGVIDYLDDSAMEQRIAQNFQNFTDSRKIVAYTNAQVGLYNDHIRDLRSLPAQYCIGEPLVNNNAVNVGRNMIRVEEEVVIRHQGSDILVANLGKDTVGQPITMEYRECTLETAFGSQIHRVKVPVDRDHFLALMKYFAQRKAWAKHFHLKENYVDLRPRDACTVHKSQGSTYDEVYIDLTDISTCRQADEAARLLYVAVSRASTKVNLYGKLAAKFGGIVQ